MKNQIEIASDVNNSSSASKLASVVRENKRSIAMFVVVVFAVSVAFTSCNKDKNDEKNNPIKGTSWQYLYDGMSTDLRYNRTTDKYEYMYIKSKTIRKYSFINDVDALYEYESWSTGWYWSSSSAPPLQPSSSETAMYSYKINYPDIEIVTTGSNPYTYNGTIDNNEMLIDGYRYIRIK